MPTNKELVEAQTFDRRRLVTAFVSGSPGGRELDPARPGRAIIGGLALAVLVVAAAAVATVLAPATPADWDEVGLVVSREDAATYVVLDDDNPELVPVLNITSAQLILGAGFEPTYVEQDVIENHTPAETIGILGAPQTLPRPDRFIQDGWTACTGHGRGIMLGLRTDPEVETPDRGGLVVTSQGRYYLIARAGELADVQQAMLYPLPVDEAGDAVDAMLNELGLRGRAEAVAVPEHWLRLFPTGGELAGPTFRVTGVGRPPLDPSPYPPGAEVGDYWVDGDEGLVLTDDGLLRLSEFAVQVYRHSPVQPARPGRSALGLPRLLDGPPPLLAEVTRTYLDASWPDEPLEQLTTEPCALLDTHPGGVPTVELAHDPGGELSAAGLDDPQVVDYSIQDGSGAFVQSDDRDDESRRSYVVDPRGTAYPLLDAQTVEKLGYAKVPAPLVPRSWVELWGRGVDLSTSLALCPPTLEARAGRECQALPG